MKRDNYRKYGNAEWNWIDVLNELKSLKFKKLKGAVNIISVKYNIKSETLKQKYRKWIDDNNIDFDVENRGGHNKIFDENQERDLVDYITNVFIKGNLIFTNEHMKELVLQKYTMIQQEIDNNFIIDPNFAISDRWIVKFKKRWKLSSLKSKVSKNATKTDPKEIKFFLDECKNTFDNYDKKNIYNLDETFWKFVNINGSFIGISGSDNRPVHVNVDPKMGFTVIFISVADGSLLKPTVILKGKTYVSLRKINQIDDNFIHKKFSVSGWITENILSFLLDEISKNSNGENCVLILDKYSVHTLTEISDKAIQLNIKLIFVPTGMTSIHQPLDVNFNGPVKSAGKGIINKLFMKDPYRNFSLVETIEAMIDATKKISKSTIENSFITSCCIQENKNQMHKNVYMLYF